LYLFVLKNKYDDDDDNKIGSIAMSRMNFFRYVGHVTTFG